MKVLKNILLWGLVAFFLLMAIGSGGVSSVFALIPVVLLLPIKKWQDIISKILNNKIKIIAAVVAFVLMIAFLPKTDTIVDEVANTEITEVLSQESESTSSLNSVKNESTTKKKTEVSSTTEKATEENKTTTAKAGTTTKETTTKNTNTSTTKNNIKETTTKVSSTTTTMHVHTFITATCINPKTCSVCGITEGSPTGHSFSSGSCISCGEADPDYVSEEMVWIPTKGGTKYHTKSTCSGMEDPEYVTKSEAISRNFGPCGKCY